MKNDFVGLLFDADPGKLLHDGIANAPRMYIRRQERRDGFSGAQAIATNDHRLLTALKLCGYESLGVHSIRGIERFCQLLG